MMLPVSLGKNRSFRVLGLMNNIPVVQINRLQI